VTRKWQNDTDDVARNRGGAEGGEVAQGSLMGWGGDRTALDPYSVLAKCIYRLKFTELDTQKLFETEACYIPHLTAS
jgi:hypothetical protein